jgi:hypothetical protein
MFLSKRFRGEWRMGRFLLDSRDGVLGAGCCCRCCFSDMGRYRFYRCSNSTVCLVYAMPFQIRSLHCVSDPSFSFTVNDVYSTIESRHL